MHGMMRKVAHLSLTFKDFYMRRDTTPPSDCRSIREVARIRQDPLYELREWLSHCTLREYLILLKVIRRLQAQFRGCIARMHAKNLRKLFQTYGYTPAHVKAARIFQKRFRGRRGRLRVKRHRLLRARWLRIGADMMERVELRRQEFLRRMLQSRKNSTVQISGENDLRLTALGYTIGCRGLITVPEGVRMLGRETAQSDLTSKIGQSEHGAARSSGGPPGAPSKAKQRFHEGLSFPFNIWKNVKAPRWSLLCKGLIQPVCHTMA